MLGLGESLALTLVLWKEKSTKTTSVVEGSPRAKTKSEAY